jgi:hypothetical protein
VKPGGESIAMVTIRSERPVDERAREALLDIAYGNVRHT